VGEARSEWRLFADVAARVQPELAGAFAWADNQRLRAEIAEVVPDYAGIETLATTGDQVQWGGRHLCPDGRFPTPDGRGHFTAIVPEAPALGPGQFTVATRRGKQFNSMVHAAVDPLTGAGRDAVYIDEADAVALGAVAAGALARGQRADRLRSRPARAQEQGPRLQRRRHHRGAALTGPA
jgi:predicted molibdopterin-dependent oxidoreductase YjgC